MLCNDQLSAYILLLGTAIPCFFTRRRKPRRVTSVACLQTFSMFLQRSLSFWEAAAKLGSCESMASTLRLPGKEAQVLLGVRRLYVTSVRIATLCLSERHWARYFDQSPASISVIPSPCPRGWLVLVPCGRRSLS